MEEAGATVLDVYEKRTSLDGALLEGGKPICSGFVGRMGGCLGETSALALLIGGIYLIYRGQIDWKCQL